MIITTSWDDGHPLDLRVADLLTRYGLPGTFYIPLENAERPVMLPAEMRQLNEAGFEIGGHTWHHVRLPGLSGPQLQREISEAKSELESVLGRATVAFCYPGGKHNRQVRASVRAAGFKGARGTRRYQVHPSPDPWSWPTSIQAHNFSNDQIGLHLVVRWNPAGLKWWLGQRGETNWARLALRLLDWAEREDGVWHLWGHSWEIEAEGQWLALEAVLREASRRSHARHLGNGELFAYACPHSA